MTFYDVILSVSTLRERHLLAPSRKAMEEPDTGVVIKEKSAYYVIKDCAALAHRYVPLFCYGHLTSPIETLKGKFKKAQIEQFVAEASEDSVVNQLLKHVLLDVYNHTSNDTVEVGLKDLSKAEIEDNPYGSYGYSDTDDVSLESTTFIIDTTDEKAIVSKLCEVFKAT